jgi:hypothetical protein
VDRRKPTPKEELSKEKRLKFLAGFQYQHGLSIREMEEFFKKQGAENTNRTSPMASVTVYQAEPTAEEIIRASVRWIGEHYSKQLSGMLVKHKD